MNKNIKTLLTIALGLVVIAAVALILNANQQIPSEINKVETPPTPPASFSQTPLSESDKKSIMSSPNEKAPASEQARYAELLNKFAIESGVLDVTDCTNPNPYVLKIQENAVLTFKNNGADVVTISIADQTYNVKPQKTEAVTAGFGKGAGIFGYGCDTTSGISGKGVIIVNR